MDDQNGGSSWDGAPPHPESAAGRGVWLGAALGPEAHGSSAGAEPPPATLATLATLTAEAALTATALGAVDLGGGVPQRGADLVDSISTTVRFSPSFGLVRPRLQPARDDDARAAAERLGDILGRVPPDRAAHEQRLAVLPLVALPVEGPRRRGHGEVRDGSAGRGEA